jgi:hypothetical protein
LFFGGLLIEQVAELVLSVQGEPVLLLVLDEGQVAVFEVLRHDVADERCEVAGPVSLVEQRLKLLSSALVDQF